MNQEEIVDNIILDMLDLKCLGSKEQILSRTTKSKRRLAMLSILDDDRQLFNDYKKIVLNNPPHACGEYSTDVVQLLGKYAKIADIDVKKHGEVMTPLTLVNEMLDTLPKEVWSNPNLKWLDPCNGIGIFPSVIVERLMIGLKDVIIGDCDRYRHIIENMLYVCEIQPKNMFLFHCAFDREDGHELNTFYGSFLTEEFNEHMNNVWGVEKFDIIIGNPPYQTQKEGNTKTHPLWHLFVEKSISILTDGGYLNMVHPDGWRNVDGMFKNTQKLLKNREVLYLEIHNKKDGIKTFGANTTYDFYCVRNKKNEGYKTQIKCIDGVIENVDLSKMEFIPNGKFSEFAKLIAKDGDEKIKMINNSSYHHQRPHMSKNNVDDFIYPCVYTTLKNGTINLWYSNTNENGHFNISKVIWSNGISTPCVDLYGQYGLTEFSYAIVDDKENLDNIKKAMLSERFIELMTYSDGITGVGMHRYNRKAISTFRKDFYKQFLND